MHFKASISTDLSSSEYIFSSRHTYAVCHNSITSDTLRWWKCTFSAAVKYMAWWAEHRRENGKIHAGEYFWHALPLWHLARLHIYDNSRGMITSHFIYLTFYGRYQRCTFIIPLIDFAKLSGNCMSWTFLCKFLYSNFAQKIYLKVHLAELYVISRKTTLEFLQIDRAPRIYICICKKYYLQEKTIICSYRLEFIEIN